MSDENLNNEARIGLSLLNAELERLIDGDVTCWGIDDAVAYGRKVAAMEREACAEIAYAFLDDPYLSGHGYATGCASAIRERSNAKLTSGAHTAPKPE